MPRFGSTLAVVVAGGALGTLLRIGVDALISEVGGTLVWSLVLVNVIGAFSLGWFISHGHQHGGHHPLVHAFVAAGVLGAFTTFSGYAVEAMELTRHGETVRALLFALGSIGVGVASANLGRWMGER